MLREKIAWISKMRGRGGNADNVLAVPLELPPRLLSGPRHMTGRLWFTDPTRPEWLERLAD